MFLLFCYRTSTGTWSNTTKNKKSYYCLKSLFFLITHDRLVRVQHRHPLQSMPTNAFSSLYVSKWKRKFAIPAKWVDRSGKWCRYRLALAMHSSIRKRAVQVQRWRHAEHIAICIATHQTQSIVRLSSVLVYCCQKLIKREKKWNR